ncbi:MAG TPA: hypothetical protein VFC04_05585 [Actinomycetota bacterium]|nr:hypothetical protein [Actinomycetota bacterium]
MPTLDRELAQIRSAELVQDAARHARARKAGRIRRWPGPLRRALGRGLVRTGSYLLGELGREGV